jgi:hypothetical protein
VQFRRGRDARGVQAGDIEAVGDQTKQSEEELKGSRQSIEAFNRQVPELELAITAYKEKITRMISTDGQGGHELVV